MADKTVVILQSSYIPWKGYFDLINLADEFVLYDDVQFTRRDWRNRNRIKTREGIRWLTIPVQVKGRYLQTIRDTQVSDPTWASRHWDTMRHAYARAPHFEAHREWLETLYREPHSPWLSEINHRFLTEICGRLAIRTRFSWSSDYELPEGRTERLVAVCRQVRATRYLSGPAARAYLDESLFTQEGITVEFMDYSGYPTYPQIHPPFEERVSILDLFLNVGGEAASYMKSFAVSRVPHGGQPPSERPAVG
jgi:WbqC-like protein